MTRVYKKEDICVEWRPELCTHCEACVNGLPQVFDVDKRPWVNVEGASKEEIINQVEQCPSGALSHRKA